jgi:hypothetical protein
VQEGSLVKNRVFHTGGLQAAINVETVSLGSVVHSLEEHLFVGRQDLFYDSLLLCGEPPHGSGEELPYPIGGSCPHVREAFQSTES